MIRVREYNTTIKHGGGSVMVFGGFCQFQSRGFAPGEGQIESDQQSQHSTALRYPIWNVACGSRVCSHAR